MRAEFLSAWLSIGLGIAFLAWALLAARQGSISVAEDWGEGGGPRIYHRRTSPGGFWIYVGGVGLLGLALAGLGVAAELGLLGG